MKRVLLLLFSACLLAACEKYVEQEPTVFPIHNISRTRTIDDAIKIAKEGAELILGTATRVSKPKDLGINKNCIYVIQSPSSRSNSSLDSDTLLYIINFTSNNGYAVVSANKSTEGLLAITESGQYNPDEPHSNSGLNEFMYLAAEYASNKRPQDTTLLVCDTIVEIESVSPMISTTWEQGYTMGRYCPSGVCGCGPLALMEVMSYYHFPTSIQLSSLGTNGPTILLDWTDILYHNTEHLDNICLATASSHEALGRLAFEIGYRANATYYQDGSTGTSLSGIESAATNLGFTSGGIRNYFEMCTKTPLDNGHPLIIRGQTIDGAGHAWIVDGYIKKKLTITNRDMLPGYQRSVETHYYNHFNWGWGGLDNGYFIDNVFNPSNYESLNFELYSTEPGNYNYSVKILELYK